MHLPRVEEGAAGQKALQRRVANSTRDGVDVASAVESDRPCTIMWCGGRWVGPRDRGLLVYGR